MVENRQYNILALSDSPLTVTGYSNCLINTMNHIQSKPMYNVAALGHNYIGQTLIPPINFEDKSTIDFTVMGAGRRPYCEDIMEHRIRELKADILWMQLDLFMVFPQILNKNFAPAKSVFYYPSDGGGGLPSNDSKFNCFNIIEKFDFPIAMSAFAQKQVLDIYGKQTEYIPIGVHTHIFKPLSTQIKNELRQNTTIFNCKGQPIKGGLIGKYVIGGVFRNQGRKMADKMIKTIKVLKNNGMKNFLLLCHCDPDDPAAVNNLRHLAEREKVEHLVYFTGMKWHKGFTITQMNMVYNLFDVYFSSTSGEGHGMGITEAMSCAIPSVVTDYTTTPTLLVEDGKCGEPVMLSGTDKSMSDMWLNQGKSMQYIDNALMNGTITGTWSVERGLMDIYHAAECITKLYNKPELAKQYGQVGRKKAETIYDWGVVGEQWSDLFWRIINE